MRLDVGATALLVSLAVLVSVLDHLDRNNTPEPPPPSRVAESPARPEVETVERRRAVEPLLDGRTPESARELARSIAEPRGWHEGDEWACLDALWQAESGWSWNVSSATDDHGIPQAHGPVHAETTSEAWRNDPAMQIRWGLTYIEGRYGTPCRAWSRWLDRKATTGRGWY